MSALFTPVIDVEHRVYCGPRAVAALTGVPVSRIERMLRTRRRRHKQNWSDRARNGPVTATYTWEIIRVLKRLGCKLQEMPNPETTFGRFCKDTAHINASYLLEMPNHVAAAHRGVAASARDNARPTCRVFKAWRVDAPETPRFAVAEPLAPALSASTLRAKPRPDAKAARAARVAARLKAWEAKLRRAQTALRKLRRQARYYGLETNPSP